MKRTPTGGQVPAGEVNNNRLFVLYGYFRQHGWRPLQPRILKTSVVILQLCSHYPKQVDFRRCQLPGIWGLKKFESSRRLMGVTKAFYALNGQTPQNASHVGVALRTVPDNPPQRTTLPDKVVTTGENARETSKLSVRVQMFFSLL